ncbi:HlyD family secretion protein [Elioraea sp.]|uniref:HlyD family secretion protein n=1 Tax=Elioraea sp. TaxID=2185103 RepID=UPI0025C419D2|nr:biotin/lipoyl-binding protein [Elioraea sp.]
MSKRSLSALILPTLALGGALFTTWSIMGQPGAPERTAPPSVPVSNPYAAAVAGLGEIEPASETVAIGTDLSGLVSAVHVRPGDALAQGAPLFSLDDRRLRAALAEAVASLAATVADRAEAEASLAAAWAERDRAAADAARYRSLARTDIAASRQRIETAVADSRKAEAQIRLAEARIASAEAATARAAAQRDRAAVDLDKTVLRAPFAGTVLRVNVRPGEYAQGAALSDPLVVFGAIDPLHVRVQVDETDAHRLMSTATARGFLRGDGSRSAPLDFVRIEPLARAKRFLSNAPGERVDTRVVEVIYRLDPGALPVTVGQMLDVFIAAEPRAVVQASAR